VQAGIAELDQVWRDEVERLVPSSSGRGGSGSGARAMVDAWQRHRFYEGLARALMGAGRPMLLVLDNVQWCDEETLAFLTFCLGLFPDAPVLLAATLRSDEPRDEPELSGWTAHLRAAGTLTDLPLGPLDDADTARLAEAIRGKPLGAADRALLAAVTGGFPLHIVEAMRAVGDGSLPAGGLDTVLRSRLGQAGPAAQEVAGLAAAVGRDFTLDLLTAAGGLGADDVVQAVDELWRRRILRQHGEGYDFSHDLVRDAAYARVSPPQRWLLHRQVAHGLELLHSEDIAPVAAQLAEQYARGGRPERALVHYRRAADVAASVFAHVEAARLHRAALEIVRAQAPGPEADREELAILEALAAPLNARHGYASAELQAVLERSIHLAESLGRRESMVNGLIGLWGSLFVQGRTRAGHDVAVRALALVEPGSEASGAVHFAFAGSAMSLGRPAEALEHFATAAALTHGVLVSVGTRPDVHGLAWSAHAHWLRGEDIAGEASARDAIGLSRSLGHPYSLAVALAYAGITFQMRGDRAQLRRAAAELGELCARYGFGYYREWALVLDGWCRGGRQGVDLARQGIGNLVAEGALTRRPYWSALLAELLVQVGDRDGARDTLDSAAADARDRDDVWWLPEVLRLRAMHDGRDAAVDRLREAARLAADHNSVALLRRCERDLAAFGAVRSTS
jgi:tetratricopeptide (TPR) repeat protein